MSFSSAIPILEILSGKEKSSFDLTNRFFYFTGKNIYSFRITREYANIMLKNILEYLVSTQVYVLCDLKLPNFK